MATHYRLELRRAFRDCRNDQRLPSDDEWNLLDTVYAIGVQVGYAKGFVHATALLLIAMLAAAVWTSM